jgi:sensor histidine kinase regulating citrate/malate metabolism
MGKAKSRINELCEDVFNSINMSKTGIDSIDALINTKQQKIEALGIELDHSIFMNGNNEIDDMELCIVIGNALDNAIEACEKICDDKKRKIRIKIIQKEDNLFLEFANTASQISSISDKELKTTKKESHLHGFGLKSIREIVEKNEGFMKYVHENEEFILKIFMKNSIVSEKV